MRKMLCTLFVLAVLTIVTDGSEPCCQKTYGWPVIDRPGMFQARGTYLDLANPFENDCGCIKQIQVYAKRTTSNRYFVRFGVWKRLPGGSQYEMVYMLREEITTTLLGGRNFTFEPTERMRMFDGAIFGMTFEESLGPIAVSLPATQSDFNSAGNFAWTPHSGIQDMPSVGSVINLASLYNFVIPSVNVIISNEGDRGPEGPQGPPGSPGSQGPQGEPGQIPQDTNECNTPGICPDNSHCVNTFLSYDCQCNTGYIKDRNLCIDDNECTRNNGECEHICGNNNGSYVCRCRNGFRLMANSHSCTDIDECETGAASCPSNSICVNTISSYTCSCNSGYEKSTLTGSCVNVNECLTRNGGCAQGCQDTTGSYFCTCVNGYTLHVDGRTCKDVNECTSGGASCPANSTCSNTVGSYVCPCNQGYQEAGGACQDINECLQHNGYCSQNCQNNPGSYVCTCNPGYQIRVDGRSCSDINECDITPALGGASCPIHSTCSNTIGSYTCPCNLGYTRNPGGTNLCIDTNECQTSNGGCEQRCDNTEGSFTCSCFTGYTLAPNLRNCLDIDECLNVNCPVYCINIPGSYKCIAINNNDIAHTIQSDPSPGGGGSTDLNGLDSMDFHDGQLALVGRNFTIVPQPSPTRDADDGSLKQKTAIVIWLSALSLLVVILFLANLRTCFVDRKHNSDPFQNERQKSPLRRAEVVLRGPRNRKSKQSIPKTISESVDEMQQKA